MRYIKFISLFSVVMIFYAGNSVKQLVSTTENLQEYSIEKRSECTQTISGQVLNSETNLPIENALVTLFFDGEEIKSIHSNSKGNYSISLNCDTNYKIIVTASNYFNLVYKFKTSTKNKVSIFNNFLLDVECYQTITGKITNNVTNEIIPNATVNLSMNDDKTRFLKTDFEGTYHFKIRCNSKYNLSVSSQNFITNATDITTSKKENEIVVQNFSLKPECIQTISGTILHKETEEPLSAELVLYINNMEQDTIHVNNHGNYFVEFQCTTNYRIIASKTNYIADSYNFLTDYGPNKQPDYFHLKKDLFLEPLESSANPIKKKIIEHEKAIQIKQQPCFKMVKGYVIENLSNNRMANITVMLLLDSDKVKEATTDSNGAFQFEIECDKSYTLHAKKKNYTKAIQEINTDHFNDNEVKLIVEPIVKFKENDSIRILEAKSTLFDLDEYEVSNEAIVELNKMVYYLNQNPNINIIINYHTDSRGPDDYNIKLTINRANTTKEYLVKNGIDPRRIEAKGYGETQLLNNCKNNVKCSDAEHAINRRIEIIILK